MSETVYGTPPARTSHVRWFLVGWIFVLSAVAYLDRVNISIAGGHIARGIWLRATCRLGLVFSSFLLATGYFKRGRAVSRTAMGRAACLQPECCGGDCLAY